MARTVDPPGERRKRRSRLEKEAPGLTAGETAGNGTFTLKRKPCRRTMARANMAEEFRAEESGERRKLKARPRKSTDGAPLQGLFPAHPIARALP